MKSFVMKLLGKPFIQQNLSLHPLSIKMHFHLKVLNQAFLHIECITRNFQAKDFLEIVSFISSYVNHY